MIMKMVRDQDKPNYMYIGDLHFHPCIVVGGEAAVGGGAAALAEMGIVNPRR